MRDRSSVGKSTAWNSKRYLGLELAGAKNHKTSVAALEYYPKEKKTFLLDIFDKITSQDDHQTGDRALIELFEELNTNVARLAVNVPLQLPPCMTCSRKICPISSDCSVESVRWMNRFMHKVNHPPSHHTHSKASHSKGAHSKAPKKNKKLFGFTPYTQRPVELWVRYHLLPLLPKESQFEVDETLGGNRAPLTARMHFLRRHLEKFHLLEVWPKLTIAVLGPQLPVHKTLVAIYRQLENGAHSREEILNHLVKEYNIFIYERDMVKLSQSLTAFDAFICAFTGLLSDQGKCADVPRGFPKDSGWVEHPVFFS